jgi:hypothetical protein
MSSAPESWRGIQYVQNLHILPQTVKPTGTVDPADHESHFRSRLNVFSDPAEMTAA